MTCHKTEFLITEYLEADLSGRQRSILEQHLRECAHCRQELEAAQQTQAQLRTWQDEPVPHWNRVPESMLKPGKPRRVSGFFGWQWAPLAISFVLALAVLTNVRISNTPDGMVVAFSDDSGVSEAVLKEQLARFEGLQRQQQEERMQVLTVRMEERLDAANVQLMESVVSQFGETTSRSLEQVIAYFEEQRQQDLQVLQSSYQQLADSDYQTVRSVQQLANYVQYQAGSR
ncbi:MAG: zf-HC2 domain-containing protein [Gammaproteobacteria bacterium]|nr:zf-HC2 domain-containing protein [Gammaproteobacteria bacterium]